MPAVDITAARELFNYGVLGVFAFLVVWATIRSTKYLAKQLFSRDPIEKGLVVMKIESSVERDKKMGLFMDTLSARDIKQQELCERHNTGLIRISENLSSHDLVARETCHEVRRLKSAAREACKLARLTMTNEKVDVHQVGSHLSEIERIIDQTRGGLE